MVNHIAVGSILVCVLITNFHCANGSELPSDVVKRIVAFFPNDGRVGDESLSLDRKWHDAMTEKANMHGRKFKRFSVLVEKNKTEVEKREYESLRADLVHNRAIPLPNAPRTGIEALDWYTDAYSLWENASKKERIDFLRGVWFSERIRDVNENTTDSFGESVLSHWFIWKTQNLFASCVRCYIENKEFGKLSTFLAELRDRNLLFLLHGNRLTPALIPRRPDDEQYTFPQWERIWRHLSPLLYGTLQTEHEWFALMKFSYSWQKHKAPPKFHATDMQSNELGKKIGDLLHLHRFWDMQPLHGWHT